jgi:hypothetical protein
MPESDQIPLSDELLFVMRTAVHHALRLREPVVTTRALLLALLDEPSLGGPLSAVLDRGKLEALPPPEEPRMGMTRLPEPGLPPGEIAAFPRYDTLVFKSPDGTTSLWLSREAFVVFCEGAQRAEGRYLPKHLAFGIAAEAVRSPGVLAALRVEPGRLTDAIFHL